MKKLKKTGDARGKEFTQATKDFKKVVQDYFQVQIQDYFEYLDDNPQLFVEIVDFSKKKMKKMSDDDIEKFTDNFISVFVTGYIAGQKFTEKKVQAEILTGISFDIDNSFALEWAEEHTGEMIRYIDDTTQEQITKIIQDSITDGLTIKETKVKIQEKFGKYNEIRSALIAQQEIAIAFAGGKRKQFQRYQEQFGVKGWKRNMDQGDSAVRSDHAANTDEGWIPADQLFKATQTLDEPHGFNCRCYTDMRLTNPNEDPV